MAHKYINRYVAITFICHQWLSSMYGSGMWYHNLAFYILPNQFGAHVKKAQLWSLELQLFFFPVGQ